MPGKLCSLTDTFGHIARSQRSQCKAVAACSTLRGLRGGAAVVPDKISHPKAASPALCVLAQPTVRRRENSSRPTVATVPGRAVAGGWRKERVIQIAVAS